MNAPDLAVRKEVVVTRNVEDTFRIFTEELGEWWPLDSTYSVLQGEAVTAVMEPKEGGRIYELTADGREGDWGTVLEFDPPNGLTMQWHPGYGDDGRGQIRSDRGGQDPTRAGALRVGSAWS